MSGAGRIASPVNFRLPRSAPSVSSLRDAHRAVQDMHQTLQIITQTINDMNGVGVTDPNTWGQLAGQPSTINTGNTGQFIVTALEGIPENSLITLMDDGTGKVAVRLANATGNTKPAHGFCSSPGGLLLGGNGPVVLNSGVFTFPGAVTGSHYFLSLIGGSVTTIAPTAAGNIEQFIGTGIANNMILMNLSGWVQH